MRDRDRPIPSVSKPAVCSVTVDKKSGRKCGAPAEHTISGQAEIFGKLINLKLKVCDAHMERMQQDDPRYSISKD